MTSHIEFICTINLSDSPTFTIQYTHSTEVDGKANTFWSPVKCFIEVFMTPGNLDRDAGSHDEIVRIIVRGILDDELKY